MLQTETSKTRKEMFDGYKHKYIVRIVREFNHITRRAQYVAD